MGNGPKNKGNDAASSGANRTPRAKLAPSSNQEEDTEMASEGQDSGSDCSQEMFSQRRRTRALKADDPFLKQVRQVVREEMAAATRQLTRDLTREIREIGARTAALEHRANDATTVLDGHEIEIEDLKAELQDMKHAQSEAENRARRKNLRFRGLPESVTDLQGTLTALMQELVPDIPVDRLELERAHRALARKPTDGPPRDIVVKFLYYRSKEAILEAARKRDGITFQGHKLQIFADISLLTLARRRELKPFLRELQERAIKYRWGFPFQLQFFYQGSTHVIRNVTEAQRK